MIDVTSTRGRSRARFHVNGDVSSAIARVRAAVDDERRFVWRHTVGSKMVISTRLNWATWGELMTLEFVSDGASRTLVEAHVAPIVPTTRADWGQGARDIRRLHSLLVAPSSVTRP